MGGGKRTIKKKRRESSDGHGGDLGHDTNRCTGSLAQNEKESRGTGTYSNARASGPSRTYRRGNTKVILVLVACLGVPEA